jgi:hypothetical protein
MNNNQLSFPKASPHKDSVNDGASTFALGRRTYLNLFSKNQPPSNQEVAKKKWIGGDRSAGDIITKRRDKAIGQGSFNLDINGQHQTISNSNGNDYNWVQHRRMFTRSSGSVVPPKCRGHGSNINPPVVLSGLQSKNNTTDGGFTIGEYIDKDMYDVDYTEELDPIEYPQYLPYMSEFSDNNILQGDKSSNDRTNASTWGDWGDDIFDGWGYFYLYDVQSGKYYFPLFNPQNTDDGIINTQNFNVFGRTFIIKHGYPVQGIFKFEIFAQDNKPFRFGAYGNMGYDSHGSTDDLSYNYSIGSTNLKLYYGYTQDNNHVPTERLFSYFIPKNVADNQIKTYDMYKDGTDMFIVSKPVTNGLIVYFSKSYDVNEWVTNDLLIV